MSQSRHIFPPDAEQIVGDLGGQIYLMQGKNHGDALFPGQLPEDFQQLQLVADVQIGRGLIQDDDFRLLAQSPGQ